MSRIDNFVVDRIIRTFGREMFEAGLEGKSTLWGLSHREYTTEELEQRITRAVDAVQGYYKNKATPQQSEEE